MFARRVRPRVVHVLRTLRNALGAGLLVLAVSSLPGRAAADALVVVRVSGPVDGRVTLTRHGGGPTYSCQTRGRTCRINGVPGGLYQVSFQPATGAGPVAQRQAVVIPPSGTATVVVRGL